MNTTSNISNMKGKNEKKKKLVGPKDLLAYIRLENIYLKYGDISSIYIDSYASFRSSNSLVLQYRHIPHLGEKTACPVFENVSNKPRKVRTCACNEYIPLIWKRDVCFMYASS